MLARICICQMTFISIRERECRFCSAAFLSTSFFPHLLSAWATTIFLLSPSPNCLPFSIALLEKVSFYLDVKIKIRVSNTTAEVTEPQVNTVTKTKQMLISICFQPSICITLSNLKKGVNVLDFIQNIPYTPHIFSFVCASELQTLAQKSIISSLNWHSYNQITLNFVFVISLN